MGERSMKPLVVPDLDIESYHLNPAISKSSLDQINKSVAHLIAARTLQIDSKALRLGRALHELVLEGEHVFRSHFAIPDNPKDDDWRSKAGRAFVSLKESEGLICLHREEGARLAAMLKALKGHETAYKWLKARGMREHSFFWTDKETGVPCRCRPDLLVKTPNGWVIVDLKTTADARPHEFARSVAKYRYHVQDAFYTDGVETVLEDRVVGFLFVAVETAPPFGVGVYNVFRDDVERGRDAYRADLEKWVRYNESKNPWEGYPDQIAGLPLPQWS